MIYSSASVVGPLAGTHTATWGMYKDAPHEGFRRYERSIVTAAVIGPLLVTIVPRPWLSAGGMALLFGLIYICERGATEFYKVFIRNEDQSKYFIPMQFHVFGRVVPPGPYRRMAAAGYAIVFLAAGVILYLASGWETTLPRWLMFGLVGSTIGWLIACGGAFKDAPIEGFETLKFFRSPVIAGAWAALTLALHQQLPAGGARRRGLLGRDDRDLQDVLLSPPPSRQVRGQAGGVPGAIAAPAAVHPALRRDLADRDCHARRGAPATPGRTGLRWRHAAATE